MKFLKNKAFISIFIFLVSLLSCGDIQSKDDNAIKEMKASDIVKMIKKGKPVQIVNAIIFDDLNFADLGDIYMTSGTSVAVDVDVPLYFNNCTFIGKVMAKSKVKAKVVCVTNFRRPVTFTACDFRDEVDFTRSLFVDNIDFSKSIFRSEVKFDMCTMRGEHNRFYEIQSESVFSMAAAREAGTLTFMDAEFQSGLRLQSMTVGTLILNNVVVKGESQVSDMLILGGFSGNYADFGVDLNLSYTKFLAPASICHSSVLNHADLSNCTFIAGAKFNECSFHTVDLSNCLFYMSPEFFGTNLGEQPKEKMVYRVIRQEDIDFRDKILDFSSIDDKRKCAFKNSCEVNQDSVIK